MKTCNKLDFRLKGGIHKMGRAVYAKNTTQKMELSIKDFFSKWDLRFTEEILNGKLHFLCKECLSKRELIHRETQYRQKKILTIASVVMRYNNLFQFSQTNCIHIKIVSLKKSDLHNTSFFWKHVKRSTTWIKPKLFQALSCCKNF